MRAVVITSRGSAREQGLPMGSKAGWRLVSAISSRGCERWRAGYTEAAEKAVDCQQ